MMSWRAYRATSDSCPLIGRSFTVNRLLPLTLYNTRNPNAFPKSEADRCSGSNSTLTFTRGRGDALALSLKEYTISYRQRALFHETVIDLFLALEMSSV